MLCPTDTARPLTHSPPQRLPPIDRPRPPSTAPLHRRRAINSFLFAIIAATLPLFASPSVSAEISFHEDIQPILEEYCYKCHADDTAKGDIEFDSYPNHQSLLQDLPLWESVVEQIESHVMPPSKEKDQPTLDHRALLMQWIDETVFACDCTNPDPGRVTIQRLNRTEYNNTIRDLLGVDFQPADDFPPDDSGYGFDNIGDVLSLSPLLMEKYLQAADDALARSIFTGPPDKETQSKTGADLEGGSPDSGARILATETTPVWGRFAISHEGRYEIRIRAAADQAGPDLARLGIIVDGKQVAAFPVEGKNRLATADYKTTVSLKPGEQRIEARFLNDYYDPSTKHVADRNLIVRTITVEGPYDPVIPPLPPTHRRIFPRDLPADASLNKQRHYAKEIISRFAERAFRRPLKRTEVIQLMNLFSLGTDGGETFEASVAIALKAVLISPSFLFRGEAHSLPQPRHRTHLIDEFSLASRLSYFLWSSMPDDRLFHLASRSLLRENLVAETRRMLKDSKASALDINFPGQWLQIRDLNLAQPDSERFPGFNPALRNAMRTETELFFRHIHRKNKSILDFLTAQYTFLNPLLARHYGIAVPPSQRFVKVSLKDTPRQGVLTHASILTLTSLPTRTSPVRRGKFILDHILNAPPPDPPANVPDLIQSPAAPNATLRDQLQAHREPGACAACHRYMDPLGFAFEHFDATGRWREHGGEDTIDTAGRLITGEPFEDAVSLSNVLATKKRDKFVRSMVEHMLTYALGRGIEYYDKCAVNEIVERLQGNDNRFEELILGVVESVPFQRQRGREWSHAPAP